MKHHVHPITQFSPLSDPQASCDTSGISDWVMESHRDPLCDINRTSVCTLKTKKKKNPTKSRRFSLWGKWETDNMHRSDNRGSWEFQPEDTLTEETGNFPSTLAQANFSGQKKAGSAVDALGLAHMNEEIMSESWRQHRKHVFVLSEAGKPIYSRYGNEEALSSTMGVMMALVSFVQAGGNMIQSIFSGEMHHLHLGFLNCLINKGSLQHL